MSSVICLELGTNATGAAFKENIQTPESKVNTSSDDIYKPQTGMRKHVKNGVLRYCGDRLILEAP